MDIRTQWQVSALLCAAFWVLGLSAFGDARSSDLSALWLAGHFLAEGRADLVYRAAEPVFTMQAHPEWVAHMAQAQGYDGPVFPYLYPPLWAALAGTLRAVGPEVLSAWALGVNLAALAATALLGARLLAPAVPPLLSVGLGLGLLLISPVGFLALFENQPQILVSFLILLAVERARADAPVTAGLALALAAALKIYPALLALLWLASRQHQAVAAFFIAGTALGLASLAATGWPLHADFLATLGTVSGSVLSAPINWNLHAVLAEFGLAGAMTPITASAADSDGMHLAVVAKPALWAALGSVLPLALLAGLWPAFRGAGADRRDRVLWPLALGSMALIAPLGWSYHYIPVVVLMPALPMLIGPRAGWTAIGIFVALCSLPSLILGNRMLPELFDAPHAGAMGMLAVVAASGWAAVAPNLRARFATGDRTGLRPT